MRFHESRHPKEKTGMKWRAEAAVLTRLRRLGGVGGKAGFYLGPLLFRILSAMSSISGPSTQCLV